MIHPYYVQAEEHEGRPGRGGVAPHRYHWAIRRANGSLVFRTATRGAADELLQNLLYPKEES